MCEFNVIIKEETVFKDAVYAKDDGGRVIIKDLLGGSREFENCRIAEVDVNNVRLVIAPIEH
jgi:predicted RNA-binding protein